MSNEVLNVGQVVDGSAVLDILIKHDRENKFVFPGVARYKLAKNLRDASPFKTSFGKDKDDLIRELGTPKLDKDGKPTDQLTIEPGTEAFTKFVEEVEALRKVDTTVQFRKLTAEDIGTNQIDIELLAAMQETGLAE